jgi:hypothetical protein
MRPYGCEPTRLRWLRAASINLRRSELVRLDARQTSALAPRQAQSTFWKPSSR